MMARPTCDQEPGAAHKSTTCRTPAHDGSAQLHEGICSPCSASADAPVRPILCHIFITMLSQITLEDVEGLINL